MKIVHVSPMYFPASGGAEWHLKRLSEGLASRGHEVTVLTANVRSVWSRNRGGLPQEEVIDGVKVLRFQSEGGILGWAVRSWQQIPGGYRSSRLVFGTDGADLICGYPTLTQLIPYLMRIRADIVAAANWYWAPAYHTYLARKLKRFTLVGIPLFHPAEAWCHRSVHKKMLAKCDAVVVNTPYEANFVQEQARIRVEVAGVGIDPESFEHRNGAQVRERYGLGNFPVVGFVGRQGVNKGVATVLRAMKTVWKWNRDVRLVLAGLRPHPDKEVETLVESLTKFEKERVVRIDDFRESDKASIYDSFDVFVMPSIAESFGIAYLEAWMCGKPVIGARIGPTQCVIDEGVDGLLVDPKAPQDTACAVIELLSDARKRGKMGMSGQAKTLAHFTWDKVINRVENLYLELVAPKALSGYDRKPWIGRLWNQA